MINQQEFRPTNRERMMSVLARVLLFGCTVVLLFTSSACNRGARTETPIKPVALNPLQGREIPHLDHSAYYRDSIDSPQKVTMSCLKCHPKAADEVMKTAHWTWISGDAVRNGKTIPLGKKNQVNNFCISVIGNWISCSACHAGYGFDNADFDFNKKENVDCLICHDGSGSYSKDRSGMPNKNVDLKLVAGSVHRPTRENCGTCHFSGGGGMGVKHGDLDESLLNANQELDYHMGRLNFQCVDCHKTEHHVVPGKVNATYSDETKVARFGCENCHTEKPHADHRLNQHSLRIACQTCHIPEFARKLPTKMAWDWSKAGDSTRKDNPHEYLKIKGEFQYEEDVVPTYAWYTGKMERYILGDKLDADSVHHINKPIGSRSNAKAKIWPFKVHFAEQPFDLVNGILVPPLTSGEGGYWTKFDWAAALKKGSALAGLTYSGNFGFTPTKMYWPITHMVTTQSKALGCQQCHSDNGRFNWKELGYSRDPVQVTSK